MNRPPETPNTHVVTEDEAGLRLDRWLRRRMEEVGLGGIFRMLRTGAVRVDGGKAQPGLRLVPGMEVSLPAASASTGGAPGAGSQAKRLPTGDRDARSTLQIPVLHQDADVWAVHKPAGVPVHGGTGHAEHMERWVRTVVVPQLRRPEGSDHFRPAPAHRLDAPTSGVLWVGVSPAGQRGLAAAFREDRVTKIYLALVAAVAGAAAPPQGAVVAPLQRVEARRGDRPKVVVADGGRPARTAWRVRGQTGEGTVLEVELFGGFMHQIRAHLAHAGMPLLGDVRYGGRARPDGLALHAWRSALAHPVSGSALDVTAPPPPALVPRTP